MNITWSKTLIDQLVHQGVDYFCLSPGFRSSPMAFAINENINAKSFIHFDERGAGFHALGYAKAAKKPAAVIVTSGTAVGNLMPAVMEAWASQVPLILITCDRPAELRDTMANQTADQLKIFGNYVRYFFDLPTPTETVPENFLATTIAQVVSRSQYPLAGPVQLNCPFREPLLNESLSPQSLLPTHYTHPELTLSDLDAKHLAKRLSQAEKGVIVLGGNGSTCKAHELSRKLGWPILADIHSSYREQADERSIPYYHHILKSLPDLKAHMVLHFGDACVSKVLIEWMAAQKTLIHVASHPKRCDPLHQVTDRVICSPETFCKTLIPFLSQQNDDWFNEWKELSTLATPEISDPSSEPGLIKQLETLARPDQAFFFGNSMPIRDADMFFFPQQPCGPIFANRGLSGIDGNIATCCGLAEIHPIVAIMGDQTFLHDLNSLAQLNKTKYPVTLIVINNGGGGIFSFLPIAKNENLLNTYLAATHEIKFKQAADLFHLPYHSEVVESRVSCVIELFTDRENNHTLHTHIDETVRQQLCFSKKA